MRNALLYILVSARLGGTSVSLVQTDHVFVEPSSTVPTKLETAAAARFEPLAESHIEYVHVVLKGQCATVDAGVLCAPLTHAKYSVPAVTTGRRAYENEHSSLTRHETLPTITGLILTVLLPQAPAQCPDLQDSTVYPYNLSHVEYAGIEHTDAVARLVVPSALVGMPDVVCAVRQPAAPSTLAAVSTMTNNQLIPAIKTETGLR